MLTEAKFSPVEAMSQPFKVAGFEVTLSGRFCLTPEASTQLGVYLVNYPGHSQAQVGLYRDRNRT